MIKEQYRNDTTGLLCYLACNDELPITYETRTSLDLKQVAIGRK